VRLVRKPPTNIVTNAKKYPCARRLPEPMFQVV
jgi:hypothetical protein